MSNYKCSECGTVNIDCGLGVFKTPREIELEKENEAIKAQRDTYANLMNVYKNISKGRQDSEIVIDYIDKLKQKLKIAEKSIEFLANGKCSSDVCKLQSREYKNCLVCFENKAQETLQKMKEVKQWKIL